MEPERTLLLSGTAPGPDGVGGIILQDLLPLFEPGKLGVFLAEEGNAREFDARGLNLGTFFARRGRSQVTSRMLPLRALSMLQGGVRERSETSRAVGAAVEFGRAQGAERVWAVLDSPLVIRMAARVADALGVPLVTTVWDDLEHLSSYFSVDRLSRRVLRHDFASALRRSSACAVIGESMQAAYESRFGVPCVVVRHGAASGHRRSPRLALPEEGPLRIGYAGSVSARSAFGSLVAGLGLRGWELLGRPVELRLMGSQFRLSSTVPCRIDYRGWTSFEDTVALLADCHVAYLPQPFEAGMRAFAELSFPSKLTTYLASGVPLLVHTPSYGSLRPFVELHPVGVLSSSEESEDVLAALESLIGDAHRYRLAAETLVEVRDREFTLERFQGAFRRVLASTAQAH